ncbi:MFS transporter [Fimbriiglobus ruber]|uniref:D-galactonate transporter n=1 Tax=Fimbriiglobus ruber TaxID=1908690 RepID=A0A225DDQ6_9BACT|nr:MFS transporter [Fimbriiglobus ruber]OWK39681.1 D-galactonate transporter [Fimbriiglobus ruber]
MPSSPSDVVAPTQPGKIEQWRWGVVWLMFLATLINYSDRLALNNTQRYFLPEFEPDPDLRNEVYANINFAFGLSFGLFQIAAGFLIDRFSLRYLYLGAILIWSAAGVMTGFVPKEAVAALIVCRVVLGVGEAFNWPCAVACIRRVIPRESRGLANGIFHSGASIGAILTPLLVLALVDTSTGVGWRTVFIVVGAVGALWAVLWMLFTAGARAVVIDSEPSPDPLPARTDQPTADENVAVSTSSVTFWDVLGMRLFWICLGTGVCVNMCWHFYNQWFSRYLTEDLRVSGRSEQLILAGFYVAADLGSITSGWVIRGLIRGGYTVESSRKLVMTGLAVSVFLATIPAAYLPADLMPVKLGCFYLVAAAAVGGFAIFFSLAQDIVARRTAQILGVCGCMSWLVISGVTKTIGDLHLAGPGKYASLFIGVGCVPLIAAVIGWFWPEPGGKKE